MSRLSADRLYVSLEPDSVAFCRFSGVLKKRLVSRSCVDTESPVAELKTFLQKNENLKVTVVLSNRLVRYAVVPSDAAVSTPEEEQALARFHFTRIYGERAKTWELRLSATRLASGIDRELLKTLRECFPDSARPRLVSVQPWLMAAYNHWQEGTASRPTAAWLVLLERERACLALSSPGGWQSVQSLRLQADEDVFALLEREALRAGDAAPRRAMVFGGRPAAPAGWAVNYSALENPYSLAMSAA